MRTLLGDVSRVSSLISPQILLCLHKCSPPLAFSGEFESQLAGSNVHTAPHSSASHPKLALTPPGLTNSLLSRMSDSRRLH